MSVLDMSRLRCPFDLLEVMCSNYLTLCCEILKSILSLFLQNYILAAQFLESHCDAALV